jgi:hypothetical protein
MIDSRNLYPIVLTLAAWLPALSLAEQLPTWEGWIIGAPCANALRVADCPLRYVDQPVLLLENGEPRSFVQADGGSIRTQDIDQAYSKKVRLTGALQPDGAIQAVRLDLLEVSGDRIFFKGCL